jgi:hypothetical protein
MKIVDPLVSPTARMVGPASIEDIDEIDELAAESSK